jgi:hypothetical protein
MINSQPVLEIFSFIYSFFLKDRIEDKFQKNNWRSYSLNFCVNLRKKINFMILFTYIYVDIDKIIQQFFHTITDRLKKIRKHLLYSLLLSTLSILIFPHKENYNIIICQLSRCGVC